MNQRNLAIRRRQQSGQALIEFALISMITVLLAFGAITFGLAVQQSMLVTESARQGALYGAFNTYTSTEVTLSEQAAGIAGIGASSLNNVTSYFCTCTPGGAAVSCTSACGTDQPMMYFQSTSSSSFSGFFPYANLPKTFSLQNTVVMPIE